jgi:protoheme IX farnesyltransferase
MRLETDTVSASSRTATAPIWDYFELTKPNVVWLILMSTMVGFYVGAPAPLPITQLLHTVFATALLAAGCGTLNQWWERDLDARMERTENRPLPSGRVSASGSLWFGLAVSGAGIVYLAMQINSISAWIGAATVVSYVAIYTPLKVRSPLATFVGAIPGAAPLLLGWAAATNTLDLGGWVLFSILFLWQFPHFYAIGWLYRDEYRRAGIQMLPVIEKDGAGTGRHVVLYGFNLIPVSVAPWMLGLAGPVYGVAAVVLGCLYLAAGVRMARRRTKDNARTLLRVSVIYLPLLYLFLVADKT